MGKVIRARNLIIVVLLVLALGLAAYYDNQHEQISLDCRIKVGGVNLVIPYPDEMEIDRSRVENILAGWEVNADNAAEGMMIRCFRRNGADGEKGREFLQVSIMGPQFLEKCTTETIADLKSGYDNFIPLYKEELSRIMISNGADSKSVVIHDQIIKNSGVGVFSFCVEGNVEKDFTPEFILKEYHFVEVDSFVLLKDTVLFFRFGSKDREVKEFTDYVGVYLNKLLEKNSEDNT